MLAALWGCTSPQALAPDDPSDTRPTPRPGTPAPSQTTEVVAQSPESLLMAEYYQRMQNAMLGNGLMRQDVAPRDAPYSRWQLVENFVHVALYDEYTNQNGRFVAGMTPSRLRRWQAPVEMDIRFGPSIPLAQRTQDREGITAYAGQLARASGHPVRVVPDHGNFTVLVLNEDERRAAAPMLRDLVPGIDDSSVNAITQLPASTFCVVFAFSQGSESRYSRAVAIIRGEHPDRLRESCVHEELAQGLGLANDYPRARPSIFNDDEEFARLTRQDELMLQMLYDPRLRPGMTEEEVRPIAQVIASELMPDG
ncbi:DUF2927 domain-containing protein [Rhodobacteraceae bacterium]|nr:DUF2927 domain-containing protein [Paracoccaceae bacterium]